MKTECEIRKMFYDYGYVMRTAELNVEKVYYADIQKLLNEGVIEQIKRGVYHLVDNENTSETNIINHLFPKAILCSESALFYHGYSDRIPLEWHLAVDKYSRRSKYKIDYPFIKPHFIAPTILELGLISGEIDGDKVRIYDKERAICELLKQSNKMDKEIFNKAIQGYVKDSQKSIPNLMQYAKDLRVEKKVRDMIGVWL